MTVRIDTTSEDSKTIVLDLTGLRSADPEGINAIRELVCGDAKLRGASPFIRLLLEDQPSADVSVRRHRERRT
jgi:hypothetical protein